MPDVYHIGINIDRSPSEVYDFASNPRNLSLWAAGLAQSDIHQEDGKWKAEGPIGTVGIRFVERNPFGVLDHDVTLESGETVHNPVRVLPHGDGSEFVFTLFRRPEMTDEQFLEDKAAVERDLKTLKILLQQEKTK